MKKILYIHGFASNGESHKAKLLRKYYGDKNVLSPSLPNEPMAAISMLKSIIKSENYNVFLIGTSLGGFYSWYLCEHMEIFGIQINPLVCVEDMSKHIGINENINTGENFEFKAEYVEQLITLKKSILDINYNLLTLFLGTNDTVINHYVTENDISYKFADIYKFPDNHRFETFETHIHLVDNIIKKGG